MLKKKESVEGLVNRVVETKLASALKSQVELEHKTFLQKNLIRCLHKLFYSENSLKTLRNTESYII